EKFIASSLSPAKTLEVKISEGKNQAIAVVPEEQLSLAIGRDGQNVRLAAKLTGWKIDVRSPEEEKVEKEDSPKKEAEGSIGENLAEKKENDGDEKPEEKKEKPEKKKTVKKSVKKTAVKKVSKKSKTENKKEGDDSKE
ncbi:MAG: transcription termination/antitermination protein NusA, partial [Candidatus Pacebacteria bacterium]|nr:transcription termination/antitermination protein NusA [Candidatus Paceibacterota bacterium]